MYFIVAGFCISLMIIISEPLSICLLAICISSLEKYFFKSFAHFLIVGFFLLLNYRSSLNILGINILSDI